MKTHTQTVYITARWDPYNKQFRYSTWELDVSKSIEEHIFVGKQEITFPVPDPTQLLFKAADALREQQAAIRAKAEAEVTNLERQIQEMLCLEFQP